MIGESGCVSQAFFDILSTRNVLTEAAALGVCMLA